MRFTGGVVNEKGNAKRRGTKGRLPISNPFRQQMWENSVLEVPQGRRRRVRYPIKLAVQYAMNGSTRGGITANISSNGMFIAASGVLPVDQLIRVKIDWPAPLDGGWPLSLVVTGRVRRITKHGMGIEIEKYEFRLRRAADRRLGQSSS